MLIMDFLQDGKHFVASTSQRSLQLRSYPDFKILHTIPYAHERTIRSCMVIPNPHYDANAKAGCLDAESGTETAKESTTTEQEVNNEFKSKGSKEYCISACHDGYIKVWSVPDLKLVAQFCNDVPINCFTAHIHTDGCMYINVGDIIGNVKVLKVHLLGVA